MKQPLVDFLNKKHRIKSLSLFMILVFPCEKVCHSSSGIKVRAIGVYEILSPKGWHFAYKFSYKLM